MFRRVPKVFGRKHKTRICEIVDFGGELDRTAELPASATQRLLKIVEKLKELNTRIDRIAARF